MKYILTIEINKMCIKIIIFTCILSITQCLHASDIPKLRAIFIDDENITSVESEESLPITLSLHDDILKIIADFAIKQNPENAKTLRCSCKLWHTHIPEPAKKSISIYEIYARDVMKQRRINKHNACIKDSIKVACCLLPGAVIGFIIGGLTSGKIVDMLMPAGIGILVNCTVGCCCYSDAYKE